MCRFMWLLLIIFLQEANGATSENKIICGTKACNQSADLILSSLNKSVDPCEDFYSFVCDGWMKRKHFDSNVLKSIRMEILLDITKILEEVEEESLIKTERKVIQLYNTCKAYKTFDNDTVKWFERIFEEIGGFPLLDPEWNENDYEWKNALSQLSLKLHLEPLILVQSKIDDRNHSRNILMVGQPGRGEALDIEKIALYPLFFEKARGREIPTEVRGVIYKDILYLNNLQYKLKSITKNKEDFDEIRKFELRMQISDLEILMPSIDWISFLEKATDYLLPITENDDIIVRSKDYLIDLLKMIDNGTITKRMIANYLGYHALVKTMNNFPLASVDLIKNFRPNDLKRSVNDLNEEDNDRNLSAEESQKILCLWSISLPLNFVLDHMFITRKKLWTSNLNEIVDNLSISLKQIIKKQTWVDKDTKEYLLEKQKEMAVIHDYPKWISDPTNIEKFYETLPEVTSNPLENYSIMYSFARKQNLLFMTNHNDRLRWPPIIAGISSFNLNAFYVIAFNTIILPHALKDPRVFNQERPNYLNYGSIGMIIGHEMGHGFDKDNIQRDKYGALKGWPNENFKKAYLEKAKCLIEQYNNYPLNRFNITLDGKKTLSQNIADYLGVRISYRAYKREERLRGKEPLLAGLEEYTADQLFFISFGTSWCETEEATEDYWKDDKSDHSPSKFRILGTITNMNEFSKAFKCKKESKMNRAEKCRMF